MSTTVIDNGTSGQMQSWPTCVILPSQTGAVKDCVQVEVPSTGKVILVLIITWILFFVAAYAIYYFMKQANPRMNYNYWMILLVLVAAGIIVSLLARIF